MAVSTQFSIRLYVPVRLLAPLSLPSTESPELFPSCCRRSANPWILEAKLNFPCTKNSKQIGIIRMYY